jgi:Flp pilus assembly pilin Flp
LPATHPRRRPAWAAVVDYALLIGLIIVIVIAAVTLLGGDPGAMVTGLAQHLGAFGGDNS